VKVTYKIIKNTVFLYFKINAYAFPFFVSFCFPTILYSALSLNFKRIFRYVFRTLNARSADISITTCVSIYPPRQTRHLHRVPIPRKAHDKLDSKDLAETWFKLFLCSLTVTGLYKNLKTTVVVTNYTRSVLKTLISYTTVYCWFARNMDLYFTYIALRRHNAH